MSPSVPVTLSVQNWDSKHNVQSVSFKVFLFLISSNWIYHSYDFNYLAFKKFEITMQYIGR